jgi:mannose-1-phosphate guanylyltransferase/mannose-6-phosphate isomerase
VNLVPVILCGGAGTRLWPVSRQAMPKPFMLLPNGRTLLADTLCRAADLPGVERLCVVTNTDYRYLVEDQLHACGLARERIHLLLEDEGRNTAPAILMASLLLEQRAGKNTIALVLPADHIIRSRDDFSAAVGKAQRLAQKNYLCTFGVVPNFAETGYGYIESGDALHGEGFVVRRFVEKPDRKTAEEYVSSGRYLWNSGMFCFQVEDMLASFRDLAPELWKQGKACWVQASGQANAGQDVQLSGAALSALQSISIDYAIFEKSPMVAVVRGTFDWSDIGSWNAVSDLYPCDGARNTTAQRTMFVNSSNTFVHSSRLVATVGVDDLLIVDTPDALLVAHKTAAQDIKQVVSQLKSSDDPTHKWHTTVDRPWGNYTVLHEEPGFKVKKIEVKPGASLSLQYHHHRSEHWVVINGTATVTNGDQLLTLEKGQSTFIPAGARHCLANQTGEALAIVETQCGDYLGEDDIVRLNDRYGRS